jgi:Zn-dependent M28 family amino/carboxypeptidase
MTDRAALSIMGAPRSRAWEAVMNGLKLAAAAGVLLLASCAASSLSPDARSWWAHVRFLASDDLEGRNTGSAGYLRAAEYVANKFEEFGAAPGGTQGYLQRISFVSRRVREPECGLWTVRDGVAEPLRLGLDANLGMGIDSADSTEAEAVFVGYGLKVPEHGHDDLAGLDLAGKIAVALQGGPATIPGPLRSHAQSSAVRWKHLRAAGAIGVAIIGNPKHTDTPWERSTLARLHPSMSLADSSMNESEGQRLSIRVNPDRAEKLFAGSGHTFAEMLELADKEVALPRFPLGRSLRARVRFDRTTVESPNVVGIVRGGDPALANEYVVLSAHLDHLGIGGAIRGDSIYNGAMDNAAGVATLIEIARLAKESGQKPRRSIILLALTGEEKGLEGSRYFAAHPTVPIESIVADVNMDMFLPLVPFERLTAYGIDESDLGDVVRWVAERRGITIEPDAQPQRNIFIRSDQYSFIKRGVPSLSFKIAFKPGSPEAEVFARWVKERYHAPSDDLAQPVDQEAAAQFTKFLLEFSTEVANRPERPRWKDESFFKRFAGGSAAQAAAAAPSGP